MDGGQGIARPATIGGECGGGLPSDRPPFQANTAEDLALKRRERRDPRRASEGFPPDNDRDFAIEFREGIPQFRVVKSTAPCKPTFTQLNQPKAGQPPLRR